MLRLPLNSEELKKLCELLNLELKDSTLENIFFLSPREGYRNIPEPEWAFRMKKRSGKAALLVVSLSNKNPFIQIYAHKGIPDVGRESPFLSLLRSHLRRAKIQSIETIHSDRIIKILLRKGPKVFSLFLFFIPSQLEAILVDESGMPVARSVRDSKWVQKDQIIFPEPPKKSNYLAHGKVQIKSLKSYSEDLEEKLIAEAFEDRKKHCKKSIQKELQKLNREKKKIQESLQFLKKSPPWKEYGDFLKKVFWKVKSENLKTKRVDGKLWVQLCDEESERWILRDPRLTWSEQLKEYYRLSKREQLKLSSHQKRLENIEADLQIKQNLLDQIPVEVDFNELSNLEKQLGLKLSQEITTSKKEKKVATQKRRRFKSQGQFEIMVGRRLEENQEITFKIAKGNDVWLHLRGRPSAHGIIIVPKGKTVSLETLLDAANLLIYFSTPSRFRENMNLRNEKIEVDYTQRKFVKRVRKSSKVTYSENKTLLIEFDRDRVQRLVQEVF